MQKKVIVVGAGIGGLAAAMTLASRGTRTVLLEASGAVGGKMHAVSVGGQRVDMGPSVLTMRHVFDELFALAGRRLDDVLTIAPLKTLARHVWDDGTALDLCDQRSTNAAAIRALFGADAAQGYGDLMDHAKKLYELAQETFISRPKPSLGQAAWRFGRRVWSAPADMDALRSLDEALRQFFPKTPKLRQLFGRYATYSGASPLHAPASLALIAHVEQLGVWHVAEGISGLAAALGDLAVSMGVEIQLSSPVAHVRDARGPHKKQVVLVDGRVLEADAVVLNVDRRAMGASSLWPNPGESSTDKEAARGLSHIAWGMVGRVRGRCLSTHNIFFPRHGSEDEFRAIFDRRQLPQTPTVYLCAPDRLPNANTKGEASERLFCLTNAPPMRTPLTAAQLADRQEMLMDMLSRCGVEIACDHPPHAMTPTDFALRFPSTDGAIYGEPPHSWHSFMSRPGSQTSDRQVFAAGGSVHPGPGVPMAAWSGRFAATAVMDALGGRQTLWKRAFRRRSTSPDLAAP